MEKISFIVFIFPNIFTIYNSLCICIYFEHYSGLQSSAYGNITLLILSYYWFSTLLVYEGEDGGENQFLEIFLCLKYLYIYYIIHTNILCIYIYIYIYIFTINKKIFALITASEWSIDRTIYK